MHSYVRDGILYIKPTLTVDRFGEDLLYNGVLDLNQEGSNSFANFNLPPSDNAQFGEETSSLNDKRSFNKLFELTDDDLNLIEENLRLKIIKNGENFIQQSDAVRISYDKFKIECEQRFIELESEFNECQSKLSVESKNSFLYKKKNDENGRFFVSFFLQYFSKLKLNVSLFFYRRKTEHAIKAKTIQGS